MPSAAATVLEMASAPVSSCGIRTVLVARDGLSPTCTPAVLLAASTTRAASVTHAWNETTPLAPAGTSAMAHVSSPSPDAENSPSAGPRESILALPSTYARPAGSWSVTVTCAAASSVLA